MSRSGNAVSSRMGPVGIPGIFASAVGIRVLLVEPMRSNTTATMKLSARIPFALALVVTTLLRAETPANILVDDPSTKFRASITCSESYKERLVTVKAGPTSTGFSEVVVEPRKAAAKIVANLAGFNAAEISDPMPLSVTLGGLEFEATLADSVEAKKSGGSFPAASERATFTLPEGVGGSGSLVFSWAKARLTVTVKCSDLEMAGLAGIGALEHVGLYQDDSEAGSRPSGSQVFTDAATCRLRFGTATGVRTVLLQGTSATAYKKVATTDSLNDFFIQSVTLTGKLPVDRAGNDPF